MMIASATLYLASPIWCQHALVAAYGWWWYKRRYGTDFRRLVGELTAHESWTREQFRVYQENRLARVLKLARRSPHYGRLFAELGISDTVAPLEALQQLPLLTKEQLRVGAKALLTRRRPVGTVSFNTSGTTGSPITIYYTRAFHALEVATIEARNLNWGGATYRDRRVMFGARKVCRFEQDGPPFWRFSPAENLAYASVYHLSPRFLPSYIDFLRGFQPTVVMGYPSALQTIAEHALTHGIRLPQAKAVFTSAERLGEDVRRQLEAAWQCRVYDRYGAVEGCVSASQCEYGRYHVTEEAGLIEILDEQGRPAAPGIEGEIVCTGLQNTLQPLIRYRIGDTARWAAEQSCPCGRQLRILEGIDGRVEDTCVTADGRRIVRFDTVFKGVENIRRAQIIQEATDAFTVKVMACPEFAQADVRKLQRNLRQHVGDVQVDVQCVADIPLTASGKFRSVICQVAQKANN